MKLIKQTFRCAAVLALAGVAHSASAQVLFSDNLDGDTSANWSLFSGTYTDGDTDFTTQWGFDYSTQKYKFYSNAVDFLELDIPPAPSSDGSTKGLKLMVNKDDTGSRVAINLYPKGQNFSGNFVLKFDLFMGHASYADTDCCSTEYLIAGVNHTGTGVNWAVFSGNGLSTTFVPPIAGADKSDGLFFMFTGEGGGAKDLWALSGVANGLPQVLFGPDGGIPDRDGDGAFDFNDADPFWVTAFPSPPFESEGLIGKRWVVVEVIQLNDTITLKIDGHAMASRPNASSWKSGNIMIGYSDLFNSIGNEENFVLIDNVRVERIRTVTVDTADNASPANDGKTSLLEAVQGLQDNDVISFNIPGAGPHYIVTPEGGYPLIEKQNVTIDGYTQPGATPNSNTIKQPNNAAIKIVLDSRNGHRYSLAAYGSNGFGDSESTILPVLFARNFTLRGVSMIGIPGDDSAEDPYIYNVALIGASTGAKIQGNWFGVDPANPNAYAGIHGARAAVASFKWDDTTTSEGLVVGTDSDGFNDNAEFNVMCGQLLALHLETPNVRVAGNFINYFPNGTVCDHSQLTLPAGADFEAFENGRGHNNLIGTDGNRVNDVNEANFIGPVNYDVFFEFWRQANNVTIAGNYIGVGLDGTPSFTQPTGTSLVAVRKNSSLRVGSDLNGDQFSTTAPQPAIVAADKLEGNHIANMEGRFLNLHGSNNDQNDVDRPVRISLRANELINNYGQIPINADQNVSPQRYYTGVMATPETGYKPVIDEAGSTPVLLKGSVPAPAEGVLAVNSLIELDIYLADLAGQAHVSAEFPKGYVQGRTFLVTLFVDSPVDDGDPEPNKFAFDLTKWNLTQADRDRLTVAATYKLADGTASTSVFADPVGQVILPPPIVITSIVRDGANVTLTWMGGLPPFKVQSRANINAGTWGDATAASDDRSATLPIGNGNEFLRVIGQ